MPQLTLTASAVAQRRAIPPQGSFFRPLPHCSPALVISLFKGVDLGRLRDADGSLTTFTQDLKNIHAIAIAPHALEKYPDLAAQSKRLLDFVREGGTLVVQRGDNATASSRLFPYPIALRQIDPERVVQPAAPVTVLDPKSRLLSWPNKLTKLDWSNWVASRAELVPSTVDSRYARVIETHDD